MKIKEHCVQLSSLPVRSWQPALLPRRRWLNSIKSACSPAKSCKNRLILPFKSDSPALMTAKMHVAVQSVVARDRRCNSKPLTTFRRYPRVQRSCIGIRSLKTATPHGSYCQRRPPSNHDLPIKKARIMRAFFVWRCLRRSNTARPLD